MSQITIRDIDPIIETIIRQKAKAENKSLSEVTNQLLQKALGVDHAAGKKRNLQELAGSWSPQNQEEFESTQDFFREIDNEMWQ